MSFVTRTLKERLILILTDVKNELLSIKKNLYYF